GVLESLELDSFGLTIVPASLVSTYCLFVEDVLDIVSDTIVVHEDAISRVQRLTQGHLGHPKYARTWRSDRRVQQIWQAKS
uniref:Uncharacterized protein n=1 Tax=Aegilops tauschii subsp. strangulata TaxID=200361 RepID=A0A453I5K7_AEGTS